MSYLWLPMWCEPVIPIIYKGKLSNWQEFSMVCTVVDHRNDVRMFKTQVEPWAAGECFHCKVLMSILWLIRVSTMEKCWFFFNNIDRSLRPCPAKFLSHSCRREKEKKSCHHHIISIICILIDHSSRPISREKLLDQLL